MHVTRAREGRVLAGVCAGMPDLWGLGTNGLRIAFALAALAGGVGIVAYLACWLVIPSAEQDPDSDAVRGVVLLAWVAGGLVGLVIVAALAAAATAFGFGWLVFGIACLVLAVALSGRTAIPSFAALPTVAALTLPAAAVALSPIRLAPQSGASVSRPTSAAAVARTVFRSGFGTLLVDLRHTRLPSSGTIPLRIDAGLRRTIVALPSDRCVRVRVEYDVHAAIGQLATLVSGHESAPFDDVVLFGDVYGGTMGTHPHGVATGRGQRGGPTLRIDFSSLGGSLVVRDYPDDVDPDGTPNWPGFAVTPEPKPDVHGDSRKVARMMVRAFHARRRAELIDEQLIDRLMPGPCAR